MTPSGCSFVLSGILRMTVISISAKQTEIRNFFLPKIGTNPVDGSEVAYITDDIDHVSVSTRQLERVLFDELGSNLGEEADSTG